MQKTCFSSHYQPLSFSFEDPVELTRTEETKARVVLEVETVDARCGLRLPGSSCGVPCTSAKTNGLFFGLVWVMKESAQGCFTVQFSALERRFILQYSHHVK